jgi:transglutaminase-like putative cysteine protease
MSLLDEGIVGEFTRRSRRRTTSRRCVRHRLGHAPWRDTGADVMSQPLSAVTTLGEGPKPVLVLEERIRYAYSRPVANVRQRLKIVPPPLHGRQRRRSWHMAVHGVESSRLRSFLDRFGNVTVDVWVPRVADAVEFSLEVEAEPDGPRQMDDEAANRRYLGHTRLTAPDAALTELAHGGERGDVAFLCERVHDSILYEWGVTGVRTTAAEALAGGRGVCQDYAHIMLAACRIAGLAARYVSGHLIGEGGSHAWVEVLQPHPTRHDVWTAEGWDPTHNRRVHSGYLVVATGRDYLDIAPLSGTYEGREANNALDVDKRLGWS